MACRQVARGLFRAASSGSTAASSWRSGARPLASVGGALQRQLQQRQAAAQATTRRHISSDSDSDSDFKPVRKSVPEGKDEVHSMIEKQIKDNKLMLYMKGTPSAPACGFSMQVVRILHAQGVDFASVNVMDYPAIREGIKEYSEWPTVPQVYLNGEFVGGCDILTQLHQSGELEEMLRKAGLAE